MKIVIEVPEGSTVTIDGVPYLVPSKAKAFAKYYLEWVCECGHSENHHRWYCNVGGPNTLAECGKCIGPNGFGCKGFRKAGPLDIKQAEHELAWIKYMASL